MHAFVRDTKGLKHFKFAFAPAFVLLLTCVPAMIVLASAGLCTLSAGHWACSALYKDRVWRSAHHRQLRLERPCNVHYVHTLSRATGSWVTLQFQQWTPYLTDTVQLHSARHALQQISAGERGTLSGVS